MVNAISHWNLASEPKKRDLWVRWLSYLSTFDCTQFGVQYSEHKEFFRQSSSLLIWIQSILTIFVFFLLGANCGIRQQAILLPVQQDVYWPEEEQAEQGAGEGSGRQAAEGWEEGPKASWKGSESTGEGAEEKGWTELWRIANSLAAICKRREEEGQQLGVEACFRCQQ